MGKSVKECHVIDHCRTYPISQKCEKDLSNCRPFVHAPCEALGVTLENFKRRGPEAIPFASLTSYIKSVEPSLKGILQSWKLPFEKRGTLPTLNKKYSIRAEVRWESWSNGENYFVGKILGPGAAIP
ncbi:MAG: hypothetical protein R3B54_15055 [Bdellovibrionota bacterium]